MDEMVQRAPRAESLRGDVMRTPDEVAAMERLRALGFGTRRISRELGIARNTVRRYLATGGWSPCQMPQRASALDGLEAWLAARFHRHAGNADVVRQELAVERGKPGTLVVIRDYTGRATQPVSVEANRLGR